MLECDTFVLKHNVLCCNKIEVSFLASGSHMLLQSIESSTSNVVSRIEQLSSWMSLLTAFSQRLLLAFVSLSSQSLLVDRETFENCFKFDLLLVEKAFRCRQVLSE